MTCFGPFASYAMVPALSNSVSRAFVQFQGLCRSGLPMRARTCWYDPSVQPCHLTRRSETSHTPCAYPAVRDTWYPGVSEVFRKHNMVSCLGFSKFWTVRSTCYSWLRLVRCGVPIRFTNRRFPSGLLNGFRAALVLKIGAPRLRKAPMS